MKSELTMASLKLEGYRFKLFNRLDSTKSLSEYAKIQNEINEVTTKIEQYEKVLKEFSRMEKIASIKRKMLK